MLSRRRYDRGSQAAGRVSPMDSGYNLLMVQPIKPYPVRQATAGGWRVVSECSSVERVTIDGGVSVIWSGEVRCPPCTHLLSGDDDRKFLVW